MNKEMIDQIKSELKKEKFVYDIDSHYELRNINPHKFVLTLQTQYCYIMQGGMNAYIVELRPTIVYVDLDDETYEVTNVAMKSDIVDVIPQRTNIGMLNDAQKENILDNTSNEERRAMIDRFIGKTYNLA